MAEPKVANTLTTITKDPMYKTLSNGKKNPLPVIDNLLDHWKFDMFSHKPNASFGGLDLSAYLFTLLERNAVIAIPNYEPISATEQKEGEMKASDSRHGKLLSVGSNQDVFQFHLTLKDMSIMTASDVGAFRNFIITGPDGKWYPGLKEIKLVSNPEENEYLYENGLLDKLNQVKFKHFIHPNRWVSFFGKFYLLSKYAIERLKKEKSYFESVLKDFKDNYGIVPKSEYTKSKKPKSVSLNGSTKKRKTVKAFNVEVDFPDFPDKFREFKPTQRNANLINNYIKKYRKAIRNLSFMTRITECSHYNRQDDFPSWIKGIEWEDKYIPKGKRTEWRRLVLDPDTGLSIRTREREKTETVYG